MINLFRFKCFGILFCALQIAAPAAAVELLTCVHSTGAIVYTRTPEVLDEQFSCTPRKAAIAPVSKNERLDPTPARSEANSDCPSTATLTINSSDYSGVFSAELRSGTRPGSKRLSGASIANGQSSVFNNVCAGSYFFAFGPANSDAVSVTRYFDVRNANGQYSNPTITVYYSSRPATNNSNRLQKSLKKDL